MTNNEKEIIESPPYIALKSRLESAGIAMENLQFENDNLKINAKLLEEKLDQLVKARLVAQNIVQGALNAANKQNDEYLQEIGRLRKEVKTLKEG